MRLVVSYLFLLCSVVVFSQQNFQGKAIYKKKTKIDMERIQNDKNIPQEHKKRIMEEMKERSDRTFILNFDKKASIYKEEGKLQIQGKGKQGVVLFGGSSGGVVYKNTATKKFLTSIESFGKQFLIENNTEMPTWKMDSETKKIGNYTCYKATWLKKVEEMIKIRPPRPEEENKEDNKKEEVKEPKEITVTAWYTPQIPVSTGPEKYWGLPGLILELNEGNSTILCTEVVLNPKDKATIKEPTKGEKVTKKEYRKILTEKIEEMRERFGGRRGGRGRRF